jgi:hypothetical protein
MRSRLTPRRPMLRGALAVSRWRARSARLCPEGPREGLIALINQALGHNVGFITPRARFAEGIARRSEQAARFGGASV